MEDQVKLKREQAGYYTGTFRGMTFRVTKNDRPRDRYNQWFITVDDLDSWHAPNLDTVRSSIRREVMQRQRRRKQVERIRELEAQLRGLAEEEIQKRTDIEEEIERLAGAQ